MKPLYHVVTETTSTENISLVCHCPNSSCAYGQWSALPREYVMRTSKSSALVCPHCGHTMINKVPSEIISHLIDNFFALQN